MANRIPQWLTKGLDEDEKKDAIQRYEVAKPILKKLRQEVRRKVERCYIDEEGLAPSDVASTIGERRGYRAVLNLIPEE